MAAAAEEEDLGSATGDHYAALGVASTSSAEELRRQNRRQGRTLHPDRFPGDAAAQRAAEASFKRAQEAYEVLGDPASREIYDRFGQQGVDEARRMGFIGAGGRAGGDAGALSTDVDSSARGPRETAERYAKKRQRRKQKELLRELGLGGKIDVQVGGTPVTASAPPPESRVAASSARGAVCSAQWLVMAELGVPRGCAQLDATQLFTPASPGLGALGALAQRAGSLELSAIQMSSYIYSPTDERDTVYLSGGTGTRANGTGSGNLVGAWSRRWSPFRSTDVTAVLGDTPRLSLRASQQLTSRLTATAGVRNQRAGEPKGGGMGRVDWVARAARGGFDQRALARGAGR
jgi:hypothetical protein